MVKTGTRSVLVLPLFFFVSHVFSLSFIPARYPSVQMNMTAPFLHSSPLVKQEQQQQEAGLPNALLPQLALPPHHHTSSTPSKLLRQLRPPFLNRRASPIAGTASTRPSSACRSRILQQQQALRLWSQRVRRRLLSPQRPPLRAACK